MSKNMKGLVAVLVVGVAAAGVYFLTHRGKRGYASQIVRLGGSTQPVIWLASMDEGYLRAWAKALMRKETQFTYNDATYNTQGGKKIM